MSELKLLDLTFSIDGVGSKILAEIAKMREPQMDLLRGNYKQYLEGCREFGLSPVDWEAYQKRFLELTGVGRGTRIQRSKQAMKVLYNPSPEQLAATTLLRGRGNWLERIRDRLGL